MVFFRSSVMIRRMKALPNILTSSRILIIPPLLYFLFIGEEWASWIALALYVYACITDFLDGYVAREMKTTSNVGKFLDPIADKLLVIAVLFSLVALDRLQGFIFLAGLTIILREVFISGLREYLGPKNIQVPVSRLAKWKTFAQMLSLGFLIMAVHSPFWIPSFFLGEVLIVIAALLSVLTAIDYTKLGLRHILSDQ